MVQAQVETGCQTLICCLVPPNTICASVLTKCRDPVATSIAMLQASCHHHELKVLMNNRIAMKMRGSARKVPEHSARIEPSLTYTVCRPPSYCHSALIIKPACISKVFNYASPIQNMD